MGKKRVRILAVAAFSWIGLLSSCYSSQQLVQPSLSNKISRDPQFLNNLSLSGSSRGGLLADNGCRDYAVGDAGLANLLQIKFGSMMGVLPRAISNLPLYRFIDEWYGTRYRLGGTDKKGIDCSAFVQRFYQTVFGMDVVRTAFEQFNTSNLLWDYKDLKEGDLVFFRIHGSRISHVGIYLMNNFFVHASSSRGVMISNLNEDYWQKYYACGGRVL